ncbi:ABC transporter substrate-binding protein [Jeongeupia naejangsanensis]|uniref:ABC transporter substrate-binding protein n=1 Tax=Jeongeupia naejangsanensis TaxID=613195 RepID=A0ABS2BPR1_9NEIS|nr:ABC transporter substrate-binding protein [Jeongeupia naejangsanensis]MBM3117588.1 ABC transporter substrate-binding protein [Jeongeupia naejangsanensis]
MNMRRWLLVLFVLLPLSLHAAPRVATVDWTIAETMLGLGVAPLAVGETAAYRSWVGQPALPATTVDIGLRTQPNRELLAELKPDLILVSPLSAGIVPTLARIAPVRTLRFDAGGGDYWAQLRQSTLELATLLDRQAAGKALLDRVESRLAAQAATLPTTPPLLLLQFIDERHVRVYGRHSLFDAVLARLGLRNAWQADTGSWGFATVSIDRLATLDNVQTIVIEPLPVGVDARLARSALWQNLPMVRRHPPLHLPAVWSFGGVLAGERFADQLSLALRGRP